MSISINNSLTSIYLYVGTIADDENKTRTLVDTSAIMNTGTKVYQHSIISQCSSMIAKYLECRTGTGYDVFQLLAALDLKGTHQPVDHGSMAVIIRYKTPYLIYNTSPLIHSFTLGTDIVLRSVLGIPYLLAMGAVVDLVKDQLVFLEINTEFPLQLDPLGKSCQMVLP